jgi:SNF2 family DNA or RNA helicase
MNHPCLASSNGKLRKVFTVLMLVPVNTITNWEDEMERWTGSIPRPLKRTNLGKVTAGYRKEEIQKWSKDGGVLFMNEELFLRVSACIGDEAQPDVLVLDEAHTMLANSNTKCSRVLQGIQTKRRILLTGTPLQNNVTELYRLVNFVQPGAIDGIENENEFERRYR